MYSIYITKNRIVCISMNIQAISLIRILIYLEITRDSMHIIISALSLNKEIAREDYMQFLYRKTYTPP
jgi:hypothetical protein